MIKVTVQDLSTKEDRTRRKSLATGEDLASFSLGHSQNVLQLHEMVQLRRLFRRQAFFLLSLDQLSDSALRFGRRQEMSNRFRSCARGNELDYLRILC